MAETQVHVSKFLAKLVSSYQTGTYFFGSRPWGILNQQWKSWHGCINGPYLQL